MAETLQARRAIEALRAGVPNRDAVQELGCQQQALEERFRSQLRQATAAPERQARGLLVAGDFGAGKSHLLDYLRHLALETRFVCSRIVISKETPLHDPGKMLQAAIEAAAVPERRGTALTEIAAHLDPRSQAFAALRRWVERSRLDRRFAALLYLYEQGDHELQDRILAVWGGDPITVNELKRYLRACGEAASYAIGKAPLSKDLARQRVRFLAQLIRAAGFAGWVWLIDEVELIGRYTITQRARSYAELACWGGLLDDDQYPGLSCTMAITLDFANEVLIGRNDRERIAKKFGHSEEAADLLLVAQAQQGMGWLLQDAQPLTLPTPATLDALYERLRHLHGAAYDWEPPPVSGPEQLTTTRLRQYIRTWINAWDLKRLYPGYEPQTELVALQPSYSEQPDLEAE